MKPIVTVPLPFDAWHVYAGHIKKFADTFKQFPPGCDYELHLMCCWGEPTDEVREWFYGTKAVYHKYNNHGCDIGSAQFLANYCLPNDTFMVMMTSRCFFHREGWLKRLCHAREKYGNRLYGCSASRQGGTLHLCTRAYAMDARLFAQYPVTIDERWKGPMFEVGRENPFGNLAEWAQTETNLKPMIVHWDSNVEFDAFEFVEGRFRNGDQNAMLVHDYHTEQYRTATPEEKKRLEAMCEKGEA